MTEWRRSVPHCARKRFYLTRGLPGWKEKERANTREDCLDVRGLPLKSIIVRRRKGLVVREASWKLPNDVARLVKSTHGGSIFFRGWTTRLSLSPDATRSRDNIIPFPFCYAAFILGIIASKKHCMFRHKFPPWAACASQACQRHDRTCN